MEYGIFEGSEWLWDNNEQKLYRKLIEYNCKHRYYNHEEFKEVNLKPHKVRCDKYYYEFRICHKIYKLHRLVYYLHNPYWDICDNSSNNIIDHKDGNGLNNSIENLNLVTHQQNNQNRKNTKGYYIHKNYKIVRAYYYKDGKQISKSFNIKKYGYDKALELAKQWREEKVNEFYYKG
jgi:hypothetical protein